MSLYQNTQTHGANVPTIVTVHSFASALGTLLGEGELLYSLLAQESFARDTSVSRLLHDA